MQVDTTRTLQLPDELASVNELEERILVFGRSLMQELLDQLWRCYQSLHCRCTLFGKVELKPHRLQSQDCGHC